MPSQKERIRAFWVLSVILGGFAAFCLLPQATASFDRQPEIANRYRAWRKGARFVPSREIVLQARGNDCGPAALKMVLHHHGIERSLAALSQDLQLTARGTSMLQIRLIATRLGLPARAWRIQPEDLHHIPLPAIAFIRINHFVVIRRFLNPQLLEVDDPALGKLQWPIHAFQNMWSGETLIFDPAWTPLNRIGMDTTSGTYATNP